MTYRYNETAVSRKGAAYGFVWMATLRELLSASESVTADVTTASDTFNVAISYGPVGTTITVTDLTVPTSEGANDGLWVSGGTATRIDAETVRVVAQVQIRWYVWNGAVGLEWSDPKNGRLIQNHALHDIRSLWQISDLDKVNFSSDGSGNWSAVTQLLYYEGAPGVGVCSQKFCHNIDSVDDAYTFLAQDAAGSVLNPLFCERRQSSSGDGYNYAYERHNLVDRFHIGFDINGPIKELESGYPGAGYSYVGWSNAAEEEYTFASVSEQNYDLFAWEHGERVDGVWAATLESGDGGLGPPPYGGSTPYGDITRAFNNGHIQKTQLPNNGGGITSHDRSKSSAIYDNDSDSWKFYYKDLLLNASGSPLWTNWWFDIVPGHQGIDECNRYCCWWADLDDCGCPSFPGHEGDNSHVGTGLVGIGLPDEATAIHRDLPVVSYFSGGLACAYWKDAQGSVDGICYALLSGDYVTKRQDYYEQLYRYGNSSDPDYQDDTALDAARAALDAVQVVLVNNFANQLIIDNLSPGKVLVVLK